ncbi:MAG: serine 3-dehydrogenase Sdh [Idiomarinaceae bacterium HL-53]|nr:MAG: serine 3-dehydrogenase Sdh [Idiomarinaceae bacterium HL-53]CUS47914.1 Short-chain dehydrogenase [Idiomarinaceae bacterium HL-53]
MTKNAVITGAAQGLGFAIAEQLAEAEWNLILLDIDVVKLHKAKKTLEKLAPKVETYEVDLTDSADVMSWLSGFSLASVPVHLLVNNAGITHRSATNRTSMDVFDKVMALNWRAPVQLTKGLLTQLQEGQGTVVVVGSMAGWLPLPGRAAYCASKAAVSQFMETWRPELLRRGIRLLMCYPSFLHTDITKHALGSDGLYAQTERSTVGRIQAPNDMAERIIRAVNKGKSRVWGTQFIARLGYYVWHLFPQCYRKITWKKFNEDIVRGD